MKARDLRNSILQMAVQGKLVPQNPADEPASALLARIREERARLVKEKKAKPPKGGESVIYRDGGSWYERRGKSNPICIDNEIPFEIPESWEWCRFSSVNLGSFTGPFGSALHKTDYVADGIPVVNPANIVDGYVIAGKMISTETQQRLSSYVLKTGDFVIGRRGEMGRAAIISEKENGWLCGTGCFFAHMPEQINQDYWRLLFSSPLVVNQLESKSVGTTMKNLNLDILGNTLVPLPPQEEQGAICAQAQQTFRIIDQFGALEDIREQLDAELPDRLRKSILKMAMQGKLVPQNPADEPASALLARIREERAKLVKEKKIKAPKGGESVIYREGSSWFEKRGKSDPVCIDDEIPFEIPESWEWARLQSLISRIHYGYTSSSTSTGVIKLLRITDIQNNSVDWNSVPYCSSNPKDLESFKLQENDVLIARTGGTIGKNYVVRNCPTNSVFASYLIRVIFQKPELVPFVAMFMDSPLYWNQLNSVSAGTGQPNVNTSALSNLLLAVPPTNEQKRIAAKINELLTTITEEKDKNA